jgi:ankyrin repeat protein
MRRRTVFLPLIFFTLLFSNHVFSAVNPVKAGKLDSNSILLLTAAQNGDTESVRRLVAEKVDIEVRDDYGRTTLHVAAGNGQVEVAALLIESGANIEARIKRVSHIQRRCKLFCVTATG